MALIKCSECGNEISDKAQRCPKCGNIISQTPYSHYNNEHINVNHKKVKKSQKKKNIAGTLGVILPILFFFIFRINDYLPQGYYVAKLPDFNAATIQVDGYMHKDKNCCKKIADSFNAEVIKINPKSQAGTNEYGQVVTYDAAFSYCPLCCY